MYEPHSPVTCLWIPKTTLWSSFGRRLNISSRRQNSPCWGYHLGWQAQQFAPTFVVSPALVLDWTSTTRTPSAWRRLWYFAAFTQTILTIWLYIWTDTINQYRVKTFRQFSSSHRDDLPKHGITVNAHDECFPLPSPYDLLTALLPQIWRLCPQNPIVHGQWVPIWVDHQWMPSSGLRI